MKITKMVWANHGDLKSEFWLQHPIKRPYWSRKWEYAWIDLEMNLSFSPGGIKDIVEMGAARSPLPDYWKSIPASLCVHANDLVEHKFGEYVSFTVCDLRHTGHTDNQMDAVVCCSVLEHMGLPAAIEGVREMERILKPGCSAIITLDVQIRQSPWDFRYADLVKFVQAVDPTAVIPPQPADLLTSDTGDLPGEKDLGLTVLGLVIQKA